MSVHKDKYSEEVKGQALVSTHRNDHRAAAIRVFLSDMKKLIKMRLTMTVVFSASIAFLIGSKQQGDINWINWVVLTVGGFLVTGSANGFNEIIEKDLDRLMRRTEDRPLPS